MWCRPRVTVVLAARTASQLVETTEEIPTAGGTAAYVVTDLTDPASIENAVQFAVATYGRLDAAFNNGGTAIPHVPITETTEEKR